MTALFGDVRLTGAHRVARLLSNVRWLVGHDVFVASPNPDNSDGRALRGGPGCTRRRRWPWVLAGIPCALAIFFVITVFTGFPGLRPSLGSLNAVADKINECSPSAAKVDWVVGVIDTVGEPVDMGKQLTPEERKMLRVNGKVGIVCGAIK